MKTQLKPGNPAAPNRGLSSLTTIAALLATAAISCSSPASSELPAETSEAILDALANERSSKAYYRAVIDRFGRVEPFSNVVATENRHAKAIETLCRKYGVEIPAETDGELPAVPDSVRAACKEAAEVEKKTLETYDELIPELAENDVRETFERLQTASREDRLPAFARCARGEPVRAAASAPRAGGCGECGMGAACGCSRASEAEKKARAAAGGGCGCAKRAAQGL